MRKPLQLANPLVLPRLFIVVALFLQAGFANATTFKNPPIIPTATDVFSIATADLNGNGKIDIVYVDGVAYGQAAVHVLLGKGDGTFAHGQDIALPSGVCCSLTLADVNGDGKPDILLAGANTFTITVAVFLGNGDGSFQAVKQTVFQSPSQQQYPQFRSAFAVGDINGDGKVDLALLDAGLNGSIYLLFGDGTGNFTAGTPVQAFTRNDVFLLDLNGDHHLDILTTDAIGAEFKVFLGKGDGTFPSFTAYFTGSPTGPFLLADVNGDGKPDLFAGYYPNQIGYFKNNGDGTFSNLIPLGNAPSSDQLVSIADLNGDGLLDLTFVSPSGLSVSLGRSGPSYATPVKTISGGSTSPYSGLPLTPAKGDFNGDGHMDLAVAVEGGIELLFGKGDGTFQSVDFYDLGTPVGAAAVGNFSGHGFQDIAVTLSAPQPRLLLGNGTGTFQLGPDPNSSYGSQTPHISAVAGDFNGDGKPDLNVGDALINESAANSTDSILFNQGNGVFSAPQSVANTSPLMADFNRDGRMDIVQLANGDIVASLGQTGSTFRVVNTTLLQPEVTGLFNSGDVNNDHIPDLVLNYRDHMEVWLGNGDGTFRYGGTLSVQNVLSAVVAAVADVDGDGKADIVLAPDFNVAAPLAPLAIYYGNGDGTFQDPVFVPINRRYSQVTVVDLNKDNKPDLVLTDGAAIAVIMNLGNRNFDAEVDYIAGRSLSPLNVVDVNGDGYPDIVVANSGGTTVAVLLNQSNGTAGQVTGNLNVSPEPSVGSQPFTATLSLMGGTSGVVPTGTVEFSVDGSFQADATLVNGTAAYTYTTSLIPIVHTVTASYNGDGTYAPKNFSVTHNILPPTYATQTTIVATPATLLTGQTERVSAKVVSAVPVPAGIVTFLDGTASIGAASLDSNQTAYLDTSLLGPGVHSLSARFNGYTNYGFSAVSPYVSEIFSPSTSNPVLTTVSSITTSVSLTAGATSATQGTVVSFTAQVSSPTGVPFGGATFFDGSSVLGTLALDVRGITTFNTASLAQGPHTIMASFNPNAPYAGSTSSPITMTILSPSPALASTLLAVRSEVTTAAGVNLTARVSGSSGALQGKVTFLDRGSIVGTAMLDSQGAGTLALTQVTAGTHSITASYAGTTELAPTVSPLLTEIWPETGPGFALQLSDVKQVPEAATVASVELNVNGMGGFRERVALSCGDELPRGIICEFSPAQVMGSGSSVLRIKKVASSHKTEPTTLPWAVFILFESTILFLLATRAERARGFVVFLAAVVLGMASGCGSADTTRSAPRLAVITVEATSQVGSELVEHSSQVFVKLPPE